MKSNFNKLIKLKIILCKLDFLIFLFLSSTILFSCNSNSKNQENSNIASQTNSDFVKFFEGSINNKFEIEMTIVNSSGKLNGTYNYKKNKGVLKLLGNIENDGSLTLNEYNNKGNITGVFKGKLEGNIIKGIWSKPDGTGPIDFFVTENNNISKEITRNLTTSRNSMNSDGLWYDSVYSNENYIEDDFKGSNDWVGFYVDKFGQTLEIREGDFEDEFIFRLTPQTSEDCTEGPVDGLAKIDPSENGLIATYSDIDGERSDQDYGICLIKFKLYNLNRKEVHTEDENCLHGAPCGGFSSIFRKK